MMSAAMYNPAYLQGDAGMSLAGHVIQVPQSNHQAMYHFQLDQFFSHFC